jgi:hypothetical protein
VATQSSDQRRGPRENAGLDRRGLRRRLLIAISLTLTAGSLLLAAQVALQVNQRHSPPWVDWATYSDALQRLIQGLSPFAARQLGGSYRLGDIVTTGYVYPPASVPMFAAFANQPLGLAAWLVLNVGLLVSGVWAILRRELGEDAILFLGLAIVPVVGYIGFLDGLVAGNVTVGLCGVLAWSWALGRDRTSPATVAIVGLAKAVPAVLVCWTRPSRLIPTAVGAGLIAGAWVLVTLPFVGVGPWVDYIRAMANVDPQCGYGPSVTCVLEPLLGTAPARLAAFAIAAGLALGAVFVRADLTAFTMIALAWIAPVSDLVDYSLLPLLVVWVVVFAVAVRRLRSSQTRPSSWLRRLRAGPASMRATSPPAA